MGIKHLKGLREYLQENANKAFSRTKLRDELKQNYPTILANLDYLINQDKVVQQLTGEPAKFQWKGDDTDGTISKKQSKDTQSNS